MGNQKKYVKIKVIVSIYYKLNKLKNKLMPLKYVKLY